VSQTAVATCGVYRSYLHATWSAYRTRAAHLVRRDDLEKAIRFVKLLVDKTDQYLEDKMA